MTLFSICDLPFWLLWLLPFLLGMLATWLYWRNKYNDMMSDYDGKIEILDGQVIGLEDDIATCISKRNNLEGDLAITKGRMREMEAEMKSMKLTSGSLKQSDDPSNTFISGIKSSSDSRIEDGSSKKSSIPVVGSKYSGISSTNLQIIEGIGPKMEIVLKENEIHDMSLLANKSTADVQAILDKYGDRYKIIDPESWVDQAKFANRSDYDGLMEYQRNLNAGRSNAIGKTDSKLEKYLIKIGAIKAFKQDDLKAIEGIGPATDKLLRDNGIETWKDLSNTSVDELNSILEAAGSRFALSDPTTWPEQAELAAKGKFDDLKNYQKSLDGGKA